MTREDTLSRMKQAGVVAVMRTESSEELVEVALALKKGGVECIEVAMTTPDALDVIETVTDEIEDVLIGAGTVLDAETARSAILAGAEYVVSPTTDYEMIKMAKRYGKVVAPGTFTPTEIMNAWQAGAEIIKVFPASRLGPKFLSDVKSPLPQVSLMPTGGVSHENAADFIQAGADVLAVGSALIDQNAIDKGNYGVITENARKLVDTVQAARKSG
ncbi:bifunctional 4-hydroxy-2-oxoglutarate aldolase/2-dehydro-3-deoxy-phosphogluconate aldolase [Candidatus Bipolaricaulota bacterium]|nr:bifunctional 4-hydroxy-2-oxoglutarate aldolase/2-dehydro-3-deoxy-phosphogluconate aldolase [Candidatus Bipolaricaulota bacterium]